MRRASSLRATSRRPRCPAPRPVPGSRSPRRARRAARRAPRYRARAPRARGLVPASAFAERQPRRFALWIRQLPGVSFKPARDARSVDAAVRVERHHRPQPAPRVGAQLLAVRKSARRAAARPFASGSASVAASALHFAGAGCCARLGAAGHKSTRSAPSTTAVANAGRSASSASASSGVGRSSFAAPSRFSDRDSAWCMSSDSRSPAASSPAAVSRSAAAFSFDSARSASTRTASVGASAASANSAYSRNRDARGVSTPRACHGEGHGNVTAVSGGARLRALRLSTYAPAQLA